MKLLSKEAYKEAKRLCFERNLRQKEEFYARYPGWKHTKYQSSEEEKRALTNVWNYLIEAQNGMDIDDYVLIPEYNKITMYVMPFVKPPAKLLILGTGTGREVAMARELGYDAFGTSLAPRNIFFAKEMVGVEVFYCDNHFLPFPDKSFDCIAGFQVLEHTISPLIMLLECNRLLKEEGWCIMETPPAVSHTMEENLHHTLCPIPVQAEGLFLKSNFNNIQLLKKGSGQRQEDDVFTELQPLSKEDKISAALEFIIVGQRKSDRDMQESLKKLLLKENS